MTKKIIGENENIHSMSFLDRIDEHLTTDKCTTVKYKWAEVKSSLLMKELNHHNGVNKMLTNYLQGILTRLFRILKFDLNSEIMRYIKLLQTSKQKDNIQNYFTD